jgi:cytochrome c oxidase subunit 2
MRRHLFLAGVATAVAVAASIVVACGGGDEGASPTAIPTATRQDTATAQPTATPTETQSLTDLGESLARRNGCISCHTITGAAGAGPTWLGLFGKKETLADGSTVLVDEEYLRESITDPNAKIVRGFAADIMPQDFREKLTDKQIVALIEYIRTVR